MDLVCPSCVLVNRVPAERLGDGPICGKCKQRLLPGNSIELTDATFQKFISRSELPVIVDFWAAWCGPCRSMAPAFELAAARFASTMIFAKLNTESSPGSAARYRIEALPTMLCFRNGGEIGRQSGAMNSSQIIQWAISVAPG